MNRKAQLPTIMLFALALILVTTSLLAFNSVSSGFDYQSKELSNLLSTPRFNQKYMELEAESLFSQALSKCPYCGSTQIAEELASITKIEREQFNYPPASDLYDKLENSNFRIERATSKTYKLYIKDIEVSSKEKENTIKRLFDIEIESKVPGE